jgi:VWFA-related protein
MRVAVYTLGTRLTLLQGFTADAALLRAAVDSKAASPGTTIMSRDRDDDLADKVDMSVAANPLAAQGEDRSVREYNNNQQGRAASMTLAALQQLAMSLEGIPGRKNLFWFASKFPISLFPEGNNRAVLQTSRGHESPEVLSETVNMLTRARVALYPVSARGLMDDRTSNADNGDSSMATNPFQEAPAIRAITAIMEQLATNTGGKAIYTTNDISAALTRDIQDGAHYYTVAYTPSNEKVDGTFRRIEVKLAEGKYQLAYRRGYYADAGSTPAQQASDPLAPLLAVGMPDATQIVYRIGVTPESQPASAAARAGGNAKLAGPVTRYRVLFQIPRDSMSFATMPSGTHDAKIRVAIVAYGHDGKPVNWAGGEMMLSLNEAQYAKAQHAGIAAPMEIDLPEAELSLATGIWDMNTQRAGTLQVSVNPRTEALAAPSSH